MQLEEFEELVLDAIAGLPETLLSRLDNVTIVVEQWPSDEQVAEHELESRDQLMGLYEGIPLTERAGYNLVLPDKITIFQGPLEAMCSTPEEIAAEVQKTVKHEIGHYFGMDHDRLEEMGLG